MPRMMCTPGTEVIGAAMLSYIHNLRQEEIRPLLEKYEVANIEPDHWYPLEPWLQAINELSRRKNFDEMMVAVGMQVAEYAISPEDAEYLTPADWLQGWNEHFQTNHRNGDVGKIVTQKVADNHYRTIHRHVYPDALNYGLAYAFVKKLLPMNTVFSVQYEDIFHRLDYGGADETVIVVKWEQ